MEAKLIPANTMRLFHINWFYIGVSGSFSILFCLVIVQMECSSKGINEIQFNHFWASCFSIYVQILQIERFRAATQTIFRRESKQVESRGRRKWVMPGKTRITTRTKLAPLIGTGKPGAERIPGIDNTFKTLPSSAGNFKICSGNHLRLDALS